MYCRTDGFTRVIPAASTKNGVLRLTGRNRYAINRDGIKIYPEELDLLFERHDEVVEACAFAIDDSVSGQVVALAARLADGSQTDEAALQEWARERIRPEAVPQRVFVVNDIPKNGSWQDQPRHRCHCLSGRRETRMTWQPGQLVKLTTERCIVRSAAREDVTDEFLGWLADPNVMVGLNIPRRRLSRMQGVRFVVNHDNRSSFLLMVCTRDNETPVGFYIVKADQQHRCGETSVVIGNHDFWGKNIVVETRSAILDFLFDELDMHKVLGKPHGRNFASIFNYKAMGFECEAVLREQMLSIDGDSRLDQLVFAMFKTKWQARSETK